MKAVRLFEFGGPDKLVYGEHYMRDAMIRFLLWGVLVGAGIWWLGAPLWIAAIVALVAGYVAV